MYLPLYMPPGGPLYRCDTCGVVLSASRTYCPHHTSTDCIQQHNRAGQTPTHALATQLARFHRCSSPLCADPVRRDTLSSWPAASAPTLHMWIHTSGCTLRLPPCALRQSKNSIRVMLHCCIGLSCCCLAPHCCRRDLLRLKFHTSSSVGSGAGGLCVLHRPVSIKFLKLSSRLLPPRSPTRYVYCHGLRNRVFSPLCFSFSQFHSLPFP